MKPAGIHTAKQSFYTEHSDYIQNDYWEQSRNCDNSKTVTKNYLGDS